MKLFRRPCSLGRGALLVVAVACGHIAVAAPPPNVIVILTDDLGYADVGVQGQARDVRTPHLDRFAAEGVRCTAGYITAPQCSPSRAGLLTGRYQQRYGIDTIPDMPLPLEAMTIPERLARAAIREGRWKLLHKAGEPDRLFDLESDQHERRDLTALQPGAAAALRRKLEQWTEGLQPRGLPGERRNAQERGWYQEYFAR